MSASKSRVKYPLRYISAISTTEPTSPSKLSKFYNSLSKVFFHLLCNTSKQYSKTKSVGTDSDPCHA